MGAIAILVIAVTQGWGLYGLHYAIEHKVWPSTEPAWLLALYAVTLLVPLALQLLAGRLRERPVWLLAGATALLSGGLCGYVGSTIESMSDRTFDFVFIVALYGPLFVAWFVALPFVQARLRRDAWKASYPDLFELAWQNALVLSEAAAFTAAFWLLLALWAALFKVIDIRFFADLFSNRMFIYPFTAIVFGYAIHLIESNEKIVVTLRRHLLGVFSWLLPLVAFIAVLFLLALPFTGLEPLWKTGHASALMLCLQLIFIHFLNAAYQDGQAEPRYPSWLKTLIRAAAFALPIYAALCAYSLGLRVEQHGWSVPRVWAAIGVVLAGLYGLGYTAAALWRSPWMGKLAQVNVAMAVVTAATALLAISPLLDPRRLAAASQLERVRSGHVPPAGFDYDHLRFALGRYGREALAELARDPNPEIARLAAISLAKTARRPDSAEPTPEFLASRIDLHPAGTTVHPSFLAYLAREVKAKPTEHPFCLRIASHLPCLMLAVDLNGDGRNEILTFNGFPLAVYSEVGGQWSKVGHLANDGREGRDPESLIRDGRIRTERHAWDDVLLDGSRYTVQPAP